MKKIILLLLTTLTLLISNEPKNIEKVSLYKTTNLALTLNEIKSKEIIFHTLKKAEIFENKKMGYWLKVQLSKTMKSGEYMVHYGALDFSFSSFSTDQNMYKVNVLGGSKKLIFQYKKGTDSRDYYFKLLPLMTAEYPFIHIESIDDYYNGLNEYFYYLLFCGLILGLIFMAGLYNAFMYYYNRESSFIYYAFMQFFMVSILFYYSGLVSFSGNFYLIYEGLSLMAALFATLFSRSFFNTKKFLPFFDKLLVSYIFLILFDLVLLYFKHISLVSELKLYSIFGLFYLLIAAIRYKQGFYPAIFFLIGWGGLIFSLVITEYLSIDLYVDPLLLGSPMEAIFLAIALTHKVKLIQNKQEQQKELMVHKSKLASMGEMIGNIAHQWRQPLTHLSYTVMNIQHAFKHNSLDKQYLDKKVNEANGQIEFMSQTIDDFRDFYTMKKKKESFSLVVESRKVLSIMSHALEEQDIEVEFIVKKDLAIVNYKNEYKQVLLNLLSNAKDALVKNVTLSPKIIITVDKNVITIADNAGGIDSEIIHKIFEPYFTTKEEHSGIGLYMSKMIIEKNMGGKLMVYNAFDGAIFKILL